jgi:hypothetical protein
MRWFVCVLLAAATWGLYWTLPAIEQSRNWSEDQVVSEAIIIRMLVFLASGLTWAIYLAATLVPKIADWVIDLIFGVKGLRPVGFGREKVSPPEEEKPPSSTE